MLAYVWRRARDAETSAACLIDLGSEVVSVDNFLTGRAANLNVLVGHPRFRSLDHDITLSFFSDGDAIFNLACPEALRGTSFNKLRWFWLSSKYCNLVWSLALFKYRR
jgi:hypothetical protein